MRRLLVTGGLGFIGSNLISYLLDRHSDWTIINLDAVTYAGHLENQRKFDENDRYIFVRGKIQDRQLISEMMSGSMHGTIDAIINVAAETHVDRSIVDSGIFVETNVLGTQVLLEAARHYLWRQPDGWGSFRFLQVSTDEVYGSAVPGQYFSEESNLAPSSPYAASKAGGDHICRAYHQTYALPILITRASNTYGPNQHPEKLIPLFIANILNDQPVPLYGDGLNVRDWLHVEDHCAALEQVLLKGAPGQVYNVGSSNERTNLEVTRIILEELGRSESLIDFVTDRLGHDRRYALDTTKIRKELGWSPQQEFQAGMLQTIRWYRENQKWLEVTRALG